MEAALDKIEARTFGNEDKAVYDVAATRLPPDQRAPSVLVLARYYRIMEKRPVEALKLLGPLVWTEDDAVSWAKDQEKAETIFRASPKAASTPDALNKVLADCPAVMPAKITATNARCVLEMGRCFADLERYVQAFAIFDGVGAKFEEVLRARASDATADAMAATREWEKASQHYQFAVNVLEATAEYFDRELTPEEQKLRRQIWSKLAPVESEIEKDKYGKDWVKYKNAEIKRRKEQSYLEAYSLFREIIANHPQTIYAEASECYSIDCLLALHREADRKRAAQLVEQEKKRLQELTKTLRDGQGRSPRGPALEELAQKVSAQETLIKSLEAIPTGPKAASLAETRAADFLKRDPSGLYQGEVLVMLGRHYLEVVFDPARAEDYFSRATKWCEKADKNPERGALLEAPAKARQVSAPPASDRTTDEWTNVKIQEPKPGAIVNQTTCSWYVKRLHREAVLKWGLTAYARSDIELAKKLWGSLHEIDPFFAEEEKKGWGSVVERLMWNAEHQPGGLYAEAAEMAAFRDPHMRLSVLLADLAFENEEYEVAAEKYRALLAEPFGRLSKAEKAFLTFALARSLDLQFQEKEVEKLIADFDKQFASTPTMPRFLLYRGSRRLSNVVKVRPGSEEWKKGTQDYANLIANFPASTDADCALYDWGWTYYLANDFPEAQKKFEEYLRRYPNGIWKEAAAYYRDAAQDKRSINDQH